MSFYRNNKYYPINHYEPHHFLLKPPVYPTPFRPGPFHSLSLHPALNQLAGGAEGGDSPIRHLSLHLLKQGTEVLIPLHVQRPLFK